MAELPGAWNLRALSKSKVKWPAHRDVTIASPEIRALLTPDNEVVGGFENKGHRGQALALRP